MTATSLIYKIHSLPPEMQMEIEHYIDFLLERYVQTQQPAPKKRKAGFSKGTFVMGEDFNEPLEDFKEYME